MRVRAAAVLALAAGLACGGSDPAAPAEVIVTGEAGARLTVRAEVADESEEWRRGLMGRESLAADAGMLFVFGAAAPRSFWMHQTPIPLDLLVIRGGVVVQIISMEPCAGPASACPRYPTEVADSALEVPAGTAARAGILPGALVEVRYREDGL